MASAKDPGIVAYGDLIKAVAFRLLAADTHLIKARESKEGPNIIDLEFAALQMRQICETVLLASFVLHTDFVEDIAARLHKNDRWDKLKKMLASQNDRFMPEPITIISENNGTKSLKIVEEDTISANELFKMWGHFSQSLHYRNPLKGPIDLQAFTIELSGSLEKLTKLLRHHAVHLPNLEVIFIVQIAMTDGIPKVTWTPLNRVDE